MAGQRLDVVLKTSFSLSRSRVRQAIKQGLCILNGNVVLEADKKLACGDEIEFHLPVASTHLAPERMTARIIWQDEDLVICDKPPGLTTHPCPSCTENTLVQQLLDAFPCISEMGGDRPGIVHRLDKDTSGLIAVALHEAARTAMAEKFAKREIRKEYLCLVKGKPLENGSCAKPIARHPEIKTRMATIAQGRAALTTWRLLRYFPESDFSLLAVRIHTGRTHQIRVHMASLGYPLLGDKVYGTAVVARMAPRQMLHAWRLEFQHPFKGERLSFESSPPEDFMETISGNTLSTQLLVITGKPGSGKSAVTDVLAREGYPAISADEIITELYNGSTPLVDWVKINIGSSILDDQGSICKDKLFPFLQKDPLLKKEFETYAHELVFERIEDFWRQERQNGAEFVIAEIPLYFESRFPGKFKTKPFVLGVDCPKEIRWNRLKNIRGWDEEKIAAIDSWQWPDAKKMAACDVVVENAGTLEELALGVDEALATIKAMGAEKRRKLALDVNKLCQSTPDDAGQHGEDDIAR